MTSQQIGDFRILRPLGRGGMGAVYEAVRDDTGESVAIKVLLASLTAEAALRQRFASEINTLKHLRHPNIVKLHGFGNDQGNPYYVMELIDGNSLAQELKRRQHFEWIEVAKIGLDLALALKYASDRGIIHRDIKPGNVMLDRKAGIVKLSDFGIAHCFTADQTSDLQSVIGTLEYMAPEQALGRPVGHRADLYALGAVLYVLLSGKPPHTGKTLTDIRRKHREEPILPLREVIRQKDVPEELTFLIEELLKFEPNQRPNNAQLVSRRLQATLRALVGDPAKILLTVTAEIQPNEPHAKPTVTLDKAAVSASSITPPVHEATQHSSTQQESLHNSHFVVVREEELGAIDEAPKVFRPLVVAKIVALIVTLAGLIAGAVFLLKPLTDDQLAKRLHATLTEGDASGGGDDNDRLASLRVAQHDLEQFTRRFPDDNRSVIYRAYLDELTAGERQRRLEGRLTRLEPHLLLPIERVYLEALSLQKSDPDQAATRWRAIISLFESTEPSSPTPIGRRRTRSEQVLESARQQLLASERFGATIERETIVTLRQRLAEAAALDATYPERAAAMRDALVTLYGDKPWVAAVIRETSHTSAGLEPPTLSVPPLGNTPPSLSD